MSSDLVRAQQLTRAYEAAIELTDALQHGGLVVLAREAIEVRELVFAELLNLYIGTAEGRVREYLNTVGIGERLLHEARMILREQGERRAALVGALAADFKKAIEGSEVLLIDGIGGAVPEVT